MAQDTVYFTTPVGRFVQGDAFVGSDKDMNGRPRLDKKGQPKTQWFIGVAFAKNDPAFGPMMQQIQAVAQRDFPGGQFQRPDFAWKVVDGDRPDQQGNAPAEHLRGHWIIRFSSGIAPKVFNAQNAPIIQDPQFPDAVKAQIKRGDYVRVYVGVVGNDDAQKPGLYMNQSMIQVVGFGAEIQGGPSAAQVFGAPVTLPPGASATPVAPAAPMPAAMTAPAPHPMQSAPVVAQPVPVTPPAAVAQPAATTVSPTSVQPYNAFLQGPTA